MRIPSLRLLGYALLLLIMATCTTEEETITPREYPRLTTLPVTDISRDGARFNAEFILRGDYTIEEYGFIYSDDLVWQMDFHGSERISMDGNVGAEGFSAMISRNLKENEEYHVKAFARTADYLVLGEPVKFQSQGSNGPELKNITPSSGHIGDEIEITSASFGKKEYRVKVYVEGVEAEITSFSQSAIKFLVPDSVAKEYLTISVIVNGNASYLEEKFQLHKPVISRIEPVQTSFDSELTIHGENFNTDEGAVSVIFNGFKETPFQSKIVSVTEDKVVVVVPGAVNIKEPGITVKMNNMESQQAKAIRIKDPVISSLSSHTARTSENITIIGENFSPEAALNDVRIDGIEAEIVEARADSLTVIIPSQENHFYSSRNVEVSVEILGEKTQADIPLQLIDKWFRLPDTPISGHNYFLKGASANEEGYVIIEDQFWKYDPVTMDWQQRSAYPGSNNIRPGTFTIEDNIYAMAGIELYEYNTVTDTWTRKGNVPYSGRRNLLTFSYNDKGYAGTGRSYDYNSYYSDMWKYDPSSDSWTQIADYPATYGRYGGVATPLNGQVYTGLGGSRSVGSHNYEMYKFDPSVEEWTQFENFPFQSLSNPMAFTLNGKAYFGVKDEMQGKIILWHYDGLSWQKVSEIRLNVKYLFTVNEIAYFASPSSNQFWIFDAQQPD